MDSFNTLLVRANILFFKLDGLNCHQSELHNDSNNWNIVSNRYKESLYNGLLFTISIRTIGRVPTDGISLSFAEQTKNVHKFECETSSEWCNATIIPSVS